MKNKRVKKVAFFVGLFPAVSETFIINQICDLMDRGVQVDIYAFDRGDAKNVSDRFFEYELSNKVKYLNFRKNRYLRIFAFIYCGLFVLFLKPKVFVRFLKVNKGRGYGSLMNYLFWIKSCLFIGGKYDLVHCHFGRMANRYILISEILKLKEKMVTTFYGMDVSMLPKLKGDRYYDELKKKCNLYFVMSKNMKERVVQLGFDEKKIKVLPVSIDVSSIQFSRRKPVKRGKEFKIISVGRFVEKKGFDDLFRALAIVRSKTKKKIRCDVVGDGNLRCELVKLVKDLKIEDIVQFKGFMKIEGVLKIFKNKHLFVQPSKTAKNGDME